MSNYVCPCVQMAKGKKIKDIEKEADFPVTDHYYFYAIAMNPWEIANVPEEIMSSELCISAVAKEPMALEAVPEDWRTVAVCEVACFTNTKAFRFVPEWIKSIIAPMVATVHTGALKDVMYPGIKNNVFRRAVMAHPYAIQSVPEESQTKELWKIAIEGDSWLEDLMPEKFK